MGLARSLPLSLPGIFFKVGIIAGGGRGREAHIKKDASDYIIQKRLLFSLKRCGKKCLKPGWIELLHSMLLISDTMSLL